MTREEAIKILTETQVFYFAQYGKEKTQEALDMAIEALSDRQKGKWNNIPIGDLKQCSNCGYICTPILAYQDIHNFCPNCGAKMDKEVSNDQERGFGDHV